MKNMVFYWDAKWDGQLYILDKLVTAGKLTVEEAAEQVDVPVDEFKSILSNMHATVSTTAPTASS